MKKVVILLVVFVWSSLLTETNACTGITLRTIENLPVTARTIEWAATPLNAMYVVVPRGYKQQSYLPNGERKGKKFIAQYGYVGIAVEQAEFVMEGINETGLGAGLFYFPEYGKYAPRSSFHKY